MLNSKEQSKHDKKKSVVIEATNAPSDQIIERLPSPIQQKRDEDANINVLASSSSIMSINTDFLQEVSLSESEINAAYVKKENVILFQHSNEPNIIDPSKLEDVPDVVSVSGDDNDTNQPQLYNIDPEKEAFVRSFHSLKEITN